MKKLAKLLSLVLALGMLGSLCAPALAEETTLEVWYALSGTSGEAFLSIVDDFNAQNPDVKVVTSYSGGYTDTATKITSALASNTTPDVLIGGQVTYTGAYGNFFAGEQATSDAEFNFDDVFEGLWEYGRYNGQICQIPYGISTNTMFYNKELAEAAGLNLEENAPKTWADFLEVCKTLKAYYSDKTDFIPFVVSDEDWLTKTRCAVLRQQRDRS
ncbi:MAG: ABC transporter substrate-binding protein [Lachnospiraceae bacterium]